MGVALANIIEGGVHDLEAGGLVKMSNGVCLQRPRNGVWHVVTFKALDLCRIKVKFQGSNRLNDS